MKIKHLLIIFFSLQLAACGAKLTKESFNTIHTISISEQVVVPDQAMNDNPGARMGAAFGGIVGAVAGENTPNKNRDTTSFMEANNIDVGQIVLNEFRDQIKKKASISTKIVDDSNGLADATFKLEIIRYGIGAEHDFSKKYRPLIQMSAKLVRKTGEILWQEDEFVHHMEESIPAVPREQYYTDPKILQAKFEEVAKLAVTNVLESLEPK